MKSDHKPVSQSVRVVIVVRLVFGTMQIMGATMGLIFLVETGVSALTVVTVVITAVITITSRILFSRKLPLRK